MTEDWRKALGLDHIESETVTEYKDEIYINGKIVDNLKDDLKFNSNTSEENIFVHQFLIYKKITSSYWVRRRLKDYELNTLSTTDQEKYLILDVELEETLQQYLRNNSKELLIDLNNKSKDLLLMIIKFLKLKKIVSFDANKIASKYSKVPFIGKIQDHDSKTQSNYESVIKYHLIKEKKNAKVNMEKEILIENNAEDTDQNEETESLIGNIKRLKKLYKNKTLNKDEFEKAKNKLLR